MSVYWVRKWAHPEKPRARAIVIPQAGCRIYLASFVVHSVTKFRGYRRAVKDEERVVQLP
jgi:hypothetical protein